MYDIFKMIVSVLFLVIKLLPTPYIVLHSLTIAQVNLVQNLIPIIRTYSLVSILCIHFILLFSKLLLNYI